MFKDGWDEKFSFEYDGSVHSEFKKKNNFIEEIISFSVPFEQQSGYLALSLFCAAKSTIFKQWKNWKHAFNKVEKPNEVM